MPQADEAKTALSKEVMDVQVAEKRVSDLKMTAIWKQKFQGRVLKKRRIEQMQAVDEAFSHVQQQRKLVDGYEKTIATLRADLEHTKVRSSAVLRRPQRPRMAKAGFN